ncbi:MAG: DNA-binding protein Tfx [Methanonatronarchaeales archaeon]|nr:DNA-binding protein Tfx [Methanonatronarchaeales archaeon]
MDLLKPEPPDADSTLLTDRQVQVLHLRGEGLSQSEVAERLGTSVPNISTIEKRARKNIDKAKRTVTLLREFDAPVRITISDGTDLYEVPGAIYDAADGASIKVRRSGPEILRLVHREAGDKVRDRAVTSPLTISVDRDGKITIR